MNLEELYKLYGEATIQLKIIQANISKYEQQIIQILNSQREKKTE